MKNKIRKIFAMLLIVSTMAALFSINASALSLSYSGSSTSNGTGASASTSGFTISYDKAADNICGYRFSIVSTNGLPKSGTKVRNVYITEISIGSTAYSSGQRFISSANVAANKKQLANGTRVTSSTATQGCDVYSSAAGFYSAIPQAPGSIGNWIKSSNNSYQNLQRIYYYCGSNLANATESDYVLIEPIFWVKLAGVRTAATSTELAIYGASVSGGDGYKGTDGNLYNAGSGTLWNLSNYINREFPNTLYVSSKTDVYAAVTVSTSNKYTYKQIIQNGYGCSVLTVKNVVTIKTTHTDTIAHWAWNFNGNGNNANKNAFKLTSTTFTKKKDDKFVLDASFGCQIPNGFYLMNTFGTSSVTGSWTSYSFGTSITQKGSNMSFEYDYYPTNYNIIYNLNGGTNNINNPSTYNVLYGVTLSNPTKSNAEFLGWDLKVSKDIIIAAKDHNYNYNNTLYNIKPGVEYKITMDSARMTAGTSTMFTCLIYDSTDQKTLVQKNIPFSNLISYSMTCPETAVASHDLRILIYAGISGSTSGKAAEFKNVAIEFSADGINKGAGSAFSSADDLYNKLAMRITGDVVVTANWKDYEVIDLEILPIEPNAPYRLGTEVITSYWIVNCANFDITPEQCIAAEMIVYDGDTNVRGGIRHDIVIPAMDKNLIYFKWQLPEEISSYKLRIDCILMIDYEEYKIASEEYTVTQYTVYSTPDTQYEKYAPRGFAVPRVPENSPAYARWWEYEYDNGNFIKKDYGLGIDVTDTERIYSESNDSLMYSFLIKSGYPFSTYFINSISHVSGYDFPNTNAYTEVQYINAKFPEFGYQSGDGFSRTLFKDEYEQWQFRNNGSYGSVHFIPLYYPDGDYYVAFEKSDLWTPAGMIKGEMISNYLIIDGNAYMDWFIKHR